MNSTLADYMYFKQNGLYIFTFHKTLRSSSNVTLNCDDSALYINSTAGVVIEAEISKQLPFFCKYSHKKLETLDFTKIVEENRNKSCPQNSTFVPDLPDPCVKPLELGGSVEDAERHCEIEGGKIMDFSTPDSVFKR
jgi:hypothetical protein